MLAVKNRRASDYVPVMAAPQQAVVIALADDVEIDNVQSPARQLQNELAARLAGENAVHPAHSLRWRAAAIFGAAVLCWVPIVAAGALFLV